ncbi:MAG: 3-deoxy-D-manno-octulosonic acid transferase [Candidatus Abyssobacteria bacterium SURF_17]|uniref:3-deoxy-D-manno-octulosonic acid transferase n=1 Tax=Candidatus Abyssobacteria bacterium SURF_17 TaxID=2093361 RepID=A0A419F1X4_9BACT|nr:MAG: 3-deoxy-D-manno-octulosonic acid transferase [Candidatus Abyssubacteria bacterium SURF_17]
MATDAPESLATSTIFFLYETALAVGFVFFIPYALFRMVRTPAVRAGIGQRLSLRCGTQMPETGSRPIWIQAVSLGEVKSVTPLVRKINERSTCPVLLTTTTETGSRTARETLGDRNAIAYFPLDFSVIVKRTLNHVRPRAVVLFETEIWPNFIRAAHSLDIPITIVNGRISEKSFRSYRLIPGVFKNALSRVTFAGMQSAADAERALALGARPETVRVYGNIKFDSVPAVPSSERVERLREELMLEDGAPLIVAGSTHKGEEEAVLAAYRKVLSRFPRTRLLIAPRHPERFDGVESVIRAAGFDVRRRSGLRGKLMTDSAPVILLDTIGELACVYALASLAFVGGSLVKVGGHNIIEPASLGRPVLFGPHMHHFEDVKQSFLSEGAAVKVNDEHELCAAIMKLIEEPSYCRRLGEAAKRVVEAHRGATERYFSAIERYLW